MQALQESCETLHDQCEYVLRQLESKLPEVRRDSSALQAKMEEMLEEDDNEDDDEEDGEEDAEEVFMEE